jgi:hypothetical protein
MYRIIPRDERKEYTFEQLKKFFDGKWLYLVHAEFTDAHRLLKATPVVVADSELEGIEDGIYKPFRAESFGNKADADFTNMCPAFASVFWSERA